MDEQQQGPGMFKQFISDPRNLSTALVFLASALQQRQPGQSPLSGVANAGVTALGFRGGLEQGIRKNQLTDDEIQARNLERSQEQENRQVQLNLQQQGVDLQGKQLSQNERLAQQQMQTQRDLATAVRPETPEEANLKNAMAGYYGRMPKDGTGGSGKDYRSQMFEDLFREQWKQEVQSAALENRAPDVTKIMPQMANLMTGLSYLPMGMQFERGSDGTLFIKVPGNPDGAPPASVPAGGQPPGRPGVAPPVVAAVSQVPDVPIDLSATTPQAPRVRPAPRGASAPDPYKILEEHDLKTTREQLRKLDDQTLIKYLKDPRLSKQQAIAIRESLRNRGRPEVLPGSNIY